MKRRPEIPRRDNGYVDVVKPEVYVASIPLPQWALDLLDQQQQLALEAYERFISKAETPAPPSVFTPPLCGKNGGEGHE